MKVVLADVLRFTEMMLKFQEVIRKIRLPRRGDFQENDVEHSYQLAMMAWYLNDAAELSLNLDRVLKYALVHDLPEVYAGDVHVLDHTGRVGKEEREAAALERIAAEFPEFPEIATFVRQYEAQIDDEARFVYALDKFMPMLVIYLEGGSTWSELDFSMTEILANKDQKTAVSPVVHKLNQELETILRTKPHLFPRP